MARYPSFFTLFFLRQTPKNPTFHIRNVSISSKDQLNSSIDKQESLTQVAKDVSKYVRSRPRWENTLVSDFSGIDFSDTNLLCEFVKQQSNVMLKIRFFYWVCSQFEVPSDEKLLGLMFDCLVESKAANAALRFLEFTKFDPGSGSLELFACCLFENGLIGDGVGVFDELVERGSVPKLETWNFGLNGAIRVGRSDVVWKLYGDMLSYGVEPDVETVTCLILALCSEDKLPEGYDLFRQCLKDGNVPRNVAFIKLLSGFYKQRKYYGVSALLHGMIVNGRLPGIDIYQEIIHWLCWNNKGRVGYRIFNDLRGRGYALNSFMYATMIDGLCKMKQVEDARKLLYEMIEKGMKPGKNTYIVLISGFFQVGDINGAQETYKQMLERGYKQSIMSYNTMITGLCLNGKIGLAWDLFEQMHHKGIDRGLVDKSFNFMVREDIYIYQEIIRWLCKTNNSKEGFRIFNNFKDRGYAPNNVMYTTIIHGLCRTKLLRDARKLLSEMVEKGMMPCEQTYTFFISRLFQAGDVDGAQELHKEFLDRGYKDTTMSYNNMITGLCMNGKMEAACDLFKKMLDDRGFVENTCNFMIKRFCKDGKLVEGMKFLYNLLDWGFQPPAASYTNLIEKLCEAGELQEAKGLWEDMQDKGVLLSACTQNSIIKGLSQVENFEDANSKSSPE
ncbi:hypothetical protein ACET3Z_032499 [Daucus carota]